MLEADLDQYVAIVGSDDQIAGTEELHLGQARPLTTYLSAGDIATQWQHQAAATVSSQIVKASPTFKPQTINSILRLTDRLDNPWNRGRPVPGHPQQGIA